MAKGAAQFYLTVDFNFIPQVVASVYSESRAAPKRVADKIAATARQNAPVRTGRLRASIATQSIRSGFEAEVFATAPYAAFPEYGTSRQAPQYYMTRAFEQHAQELPIAIMDSITPW